MPDPIIKKITKAGYKLEQFDRYHFRINGELDIWLNSRNRSLAWHDILGQDRGRVREDKVMEFIKRHFETPRTEASHDSFVGTLVKDCKWTPEEAEKAWQERQGETA